MEVLLFCCCLPILALIKAILFTPLCFLITTIGCTFSSIITLPLDFYKTYSIIFKSKRIGINLKCLMFPLLIIPLLLWPVIILFCSSIASLFGFFVFIFGETFVSEDHCSTHAFKYSLNAVYDFYDFAYKTYPSIIDTINDPNYNGPVFDIKLYQIIIGLVMSVISFIISVVFGLVIMIIKYIPLVINSWRHTLSGIKENICCCLGPLVVFLGLLVIVLIPVFYLCIIIPVVLVLGFYSCNCIVTLIKTNSISYGFKQTFKTIYDFDCVVNFWAFDDKTSSWLACFNFTIPNHQTVETMRSHPETVRQPESVNYERSTRPIVEQPVSYQTGLSPVQVKPAKFSIFEIWDSFFEMCLNDAIEAIHCQLCTRDDIESFEPFITIGLPSLVLTRAFKRSKSSHGIILYSGKEIDESNRPDDFLSNMMYPKLIDIKNNFTQLELSETEYQFFEKWVFKTIEDDPIIDSERLKAIKNVGTQIRDQAINITRLPQFHRRFGETLQKVVLISNA